MSFHVSEGGLEGLLPSPPGIHRRPRAMAASGVTSTISPLTGDSRPPPYDPQASVDTLRTWFGLLVEFQPQAESEGGCPLPPSPASSLRPTPTAAPISP